MAILASRHHVQCIQGYSDELIGLKCIYWYLQFAA